MPDNEKMENMERELKLLKDLIATPSFSGEEDKTAALIEEYLRENGVKFNRTDNNVWALNKYFDPSKPTILLNSHHDTVKPNKAYTIDPFEPVVKEGKLYGLGSNDAGGSVVSLLNTFVHFYNNDHLKYNLVIAITGEEESSGPHGLNSLIRKLPDIDFAIVGEPTGMHLAIAEKGLLVLDVIAHGVSGHAAHENTVNPIYIAMEDIRWIKDYQFPKISKTLGKVKMSVTQIDAGTQHNVVPAQCHFVVDIRVTDQYSNVEILEFLKKNLKSEVQERSLNLNSSSIDENHPIVQAGVKLGRKTYGSPTLSDQAVLDCPSLKMVPCESPRSHQADEFIYLKELEEGMDIYKKMLSEVLLDK